MYVCVSSDWQREDAMLTKGRTAAGDKHDSADDVPAASSALSIAVQTLTAGCDRRCEADLTVRLCNPCVRRRTCRKVRLTRKQDFICHTFINGAQAELTAFRQK